MISITPISTKHADDAPPVCTVIAGPNGSGKTTFALVYLKEGATCDNFINADLIAAQLSPDDPDRQWMKASRILLNEGREFVKQRQSFAFETTLAGRSYLRMTRKLVRAGWQVNLIYLWLPNVDISRERVAERVAHGGHNVPEKFLVRRYPRSIANLLDLYAPMYSSTICYDNSTTRPELIFTESNEGRTVANQQLFNALQQGRHA
jgi:predicted ABC-type ATPase